MLLLLLILKSTFGWPFQCNFKWSFKNWPHKIFYLSLQFLCSFFISRVVTVTSSQNIGCNHTDCRTTWHKHGVNCWDCSRIWEEKTERKTKKGCFARGNEEETDGRKWAREEEDDWANKTLQGAETPSAHKCSYSKQKRDSCSGMAIISYHIFTYKCVTIVKCWSQMFVTNV